MVRSFQIAYERAQDGSRARLNQYAEEGAVSGFVHAYLGTRDKRLPLPVADLVPREAVAGYPTDFAPMTPDNLRLLATRGEQLTRTLGRVLLPGAGRRLTRPSQWRRQAQGRAKMVKWSGSSTGCAAAS
jgi:NTE family protein